jgi:hypothetical protein
LLFILYAFHGNYFPGAGSFKHLTLKRSASSQESCVNIEASLREGG